MKILRLDARHLRVPMNFSFKHALAERAVGDSVLVRAVDEHGQVGWGECAPRPYVTGETSEGVVALLRETFMPEQLGASFESREALAGALTDRGRRLERGQQAAFCALELALLDLAGRHFDRSVGELLGPLQSESVFYSGVVSADEPEGIERTCKQLLEFGVQSVKAKVGGTLEEDLRALTTIREALGDDVSLRVDANCAWNAKSALARIEAFAPFDLAAIEQPCPADDLEASALVTRECSLSTIADESLVSLADGERIIELGAFDMFNIRVSKCGGLLLSAQLRDLAREAGLGLMLGAQVGETAVLSAAGRHLALRSEDVRFVEGSYGTLLLEKDLCDSIALGPRGEGGNLPGPGLGLSPDAREVAPYLDAPWPKGEASCA